MVRDCARSAVEPLAMAGRALSWGRSGVRAELVVVVLDILEIVHFEIIVEI